MGKLPSMQYSDGIRKTTQVQFGGLDMRAGAGDGAIADMFNLTGGQAPVLSTRPPRRTSGDRFVESSIGGLYCTDQVCYVVGQRFYVDGTYAGNLKTDGEKVFCSLGNRVVIWPDKMIWLGGADTDGDTDPAHDADDEDDGRTTGLQDLEASVTKTGLIFSDGTYAGEEAAANSITTGTSAFPFRVGDAVTISGCSVSANNLTVVIREISADRKTLRFYENTFSLPDGESSCTESGSVTLAREVPDLDYLCENENRIWGCKGDTIWCCKLGDPYNWYVFDGLSTDAWRLDSGSPGDFTGCYSFLGYPVFFKEDRILKVYGTKPSNFQLMASATSGVRAGSAKSLAIAGETLFYLSRVGVVAYSGGIPQKISQIFGDTKFDCAAGGSDGMKYYVSLHDASKSGSAGGTALYVYDPETKMWHKEDGTEILTASCLNGVGLYAMARNRDTSDEVSILLLGDPAEAPDGMSREDLFDSFAEFGDFTVQDPNRKGVVKVQLRVELERGAQLTVQIKLDAGAWLTVETLDTPGKYSAYLPIIPRRCDHFRLRLRGHGQWKLYSLSFESYSGSEVF